MIRPVIEYKVIEDSGKFGRTPTLPNKLYLSFVKLSIERQKTAEGVNLPTVLRKEFRGFRFGKLMNTNVSRNFPAQ